MHASMMVPHGHGTFDFGTFAASVAMWQIMMIAMMAPTVLQWLYAFAALTRNPQSRGGKAGALAAFGLGYFVVWLGYSIVAATIQFALGASGLLTHQGSLPRAIGGSVLIAAGLLYFTPASRACLTHCRNPLSYLLMRWHNGPGSGFRIGLTHGAYCVGCCWAVMLTGFAMGVMNMAWMAFLTVLMCVEKLAPRGDRIGAVASVAMVVWGTVLIFCGGWAS